jgi:beta-glucosidase
LIIQYQKRLQRIMLPYFSLRQDQDFTTVDHSLKLSMAVQKGWDLNSMGLAEVPARDVRGDHASLIRDIGASGIALLNNVNSTLPLKLPGNIGVFSNDAPPPTNCLVFESYYPAEIGTLDIGGGSGTARPAHVPGFAAGSHPATRHGNWDRAYNIPQTTRS